MPLEYPTPKALVNSPQAKSVVCVRVDIYTPVVGEGRVDYHFESYDSAGNLVEHRIYTETITTIVTDDPVGFNAVRNILRPRAYTNALKAGYPTGGVVS